MGSSSTRLPVVLTLIVAIGLGLSAASAQTSSQSVTSGSGQYYVEFRSRQAWDYGHTFVVFGRVGEAPGKKNVAGLSPKGDDPKMWVMGHYMPVPADTGWTDGDLEDKVHHFALSGAHQQGAVRQSRRPYQRVAIALALLERRDVQLQCLCR